MLVKVIIIIKHITARIELWVAAGTTCFLHVIFQRVGYVIMYHQSHILLVHSHTKCRGCHNNTYMIVHESILIGYFLIGFHLSVIRQRRITITGQFICKFLGAPGARHINNDRAV